MAVFIGTLIGLVFGGVLGFTLCAVIIANMDEKENGQ